MNGTPVQVGTWALWIKANIMADKKKSALLAILFVAAAVTGVKTFLPAPKSAAAQPSAAVAETPADPVVEAPRADPLQEQRRNEYLAQMNRAITRDLFAANYESFPLAAPQAAQTTNSASLLDKMRSTAEALDQEAAARQKQLMMQIRTEATALSLQSTMGGSHATAIVNGNVLGVGDGINGFTVKEIGQGQCVLVKDGVKVTLRME